MRTGARVGMRLLHITRIEEKRSSVTTYYRTQIAWVDRPPEGVRTGLMQCAFCSEWAGFQVRSEAATKKRRRVGFLTALTSAVMVAVLAWVVSQLPDEGVPEALLVLISAVILVLGVTSLVSGLSALAENGVKTDRARCSRRHRFTPMNYFTAISRPPATSQPADPKIVFD